MKQIKYFFASLVAVALVAYLVHHWLIELNDPGYVLIGAGEWSLETSLTMFTVLQIAGFFLIYHLFRLISALFRIPAQYSKRKHALKTNRSQQALIAGLFDAADGNWERAENVLIKHAGHSGAPLLHYLTAARAAQSRGALDKRDEYLRQAVAHSSDTNLTVGLTQAELHLSEQQFSDALATLSKLHSINPSHARVLKMMHQAYRHLEDWEGLSKILPSLQQNKILLETEIKLLETEIHSRLLKQAAAENDAEAVRNCWRNAPEHIKSLPGIANIYFAAMISLNAGAEIISAVELQLSRHWDYTTLLLYADIDSGDLRQHLLAAEKWLAVYPNDAVLQRVLGKLALKLQETEKAKQYLFKSIHLDPSVEAYQLIGEALITQGDKETACDYFVRALELASVGVVQNIESITA